MPTRSPRTSRSPLGRRSSVSADDQHGTMLHYWWNRAYLIQQRIAHERGAR